jgi:hypothetical protein
MNTRGYFVIVKSSIRDTNSILGPNTEYEFEADVLYDRQNGRDIYKSCLIKFFGRPQEMFFQKINPGLECFLFLKNDGIDFICEGAYWYFRDRNFYSFENDEFIQPDIILGKNDNLVNIGN